LVNGAITVVLISTDNKDRMIECIENLKIKDKIRERYNTLSSMNEKIIQEGQQLSRDIENNITIPIEKHMYKTTCEYCKNV
jgi:hypothetical protein